MLFYPTSSLGSTGVGGPIEPKLQVMLLFGGDWLDRGVLQFCVLPNKRIDVNKKQVTVHYNLPIPQDGKSKEQIGVLPIDTLGGPNITFAKPIETIFELSISSASLSSREQNRERK